MPTPCDSRVIGAPVGHALTGGHHPAPVARKLAVLALALGITSAVGSGALVIVALPSIARGLGISAAESVWVVNAYQLGTIVTILTASALGEKWGYKRVYLSGLALLIAASAGAAWAGTLTTLVAWRAVQGVGTAAMMAVNAALIRHVWPAPLLGRGISYNAIVVAAATAASPVAAGLLVAVGDWRWLFLAHVPLGVMALAMGLRVLPSPSGAACNFDLVSTGLNALTFAFLFFCAKGAISGQTNVWTAIQLVFALLFGILLVKRATGQSAPLVPIDLLARPILRASYVASFMAFVAQTIVLTMLPFALSAQLGLDQLHVGLAMTPWPLALMASALLSGRAIERHSPIVVGSIGLLVFASGIVMLVFGVGMDFALACAGSAICGFGLGMFTTPNNREMLMRAPVERSGAATGMIATVRLAGQTTGALLATASLGFDPQGNPLVLLGAALITIAAAAASLRRYRIMPFRAGDSGL